MLARFAPRTCYWGVALYFHYRFAPLLTSKGFTTILAAGFNP
jgi:hypothetical protein